MFTGTDQDEVLRLWDVRGAKLVYELSTGNNEVVGLAWDGARNVLYASTNCNYMDRNGDNHGSPRKVAIMHCPLLLQHGALHYGLFLTGL